MQDHYYTATYNVELNHWWYRVRRKIIHFLIEKEAGEKNRALDILDIGCGTGALITELQKYGNVVGIDRSEDALKFCRERGITNVKLGSAIKIPEPDKKYDAVMALDLLEHLDDDKEAMKEIKRVLRPDGVAIIFVPAFMFLWGVTDVVSEHKRRYTKKELVIRLKEMGFEIKRASYFNTFLFPPIALVRLLSKIVTPKRKSDFITGDGLFNESLYKIFLLEAKLLKFTNFPFGVSIMAVAKPDKI